MSRAGFGRVGSMLLLFTAIAMSVGGRRGPPSSTGGAIGPSRTQEGGAFEAKQRFEAKNPGNT